MAIPALKCPTCKRDLEYHVTIEMINPPVGKIDTGYCSSCASLFERVRDTGTYYETTAWPPLCRECRQPVVFAGVKPDEPEAALYHCVGHPNERWTWSRGSERWTRVERS